MPLIANRHAVVVAAIVALLLIVFMQVFRFVRRVDVHRVRFISVCLFRTVSRLRKVSI